MKKINVCIRYTRDNWKCGKQALFTHKESAGMIEVLIKVRAKLERRRYTVPLPHIQTLLKSDSPLMIQSGPYVIMILVDEMRKMLDLSCEVCGKRGHEYKRAHSWHYGLMSNRFLCTRHYMEFYHDRFQIPDLNEFWDSINQMFGTCHGPCLYRCFTGC
jgi:hypothetical protein